MEEALYKGTPGFSSSEIARPHVVAQRYSSGGPSLSLKFRSRARARILILRNSRHDYRYRQMVQRRQRLRLHHPDGGGKDLFAHFSAIRVAAASNRSRKTRRSPFDVTTGPKGSKPQHQADRLTAIGGEKSPGDRAFYSSYEIRTRNASGRVTRFSRRIPEKMPV